MLSTRNSRCSSLKNMTRGVEYPLLETKLITLAVALGVALASCATPSISENEVVSLAAAGIRYSTDGHGRSNTMECV